MRSVSIFLPPGLRDASGKPPGPRTSKVCHTPRKDTGIGAVIDQISEDRPEIIVHHVWPGSPAEAAGLLCQDVLIAVDGVKDAAKSIETAKNSIRGVEGTAVNLQIRRNGEIKEIGPIERGTWLTVTQIDQNLARMRQLLSDNRNPGLSEICSNLTRLRHSLEEERKKFQDEVMSLKTAQYKATQISKELEVHLIDMAETSSQVWECAASLEKRAERFEMVVKQKTSTLRRMSQTTADLQKHLDLVTSKMGDVSPEKMSEALQTFQQKAVSLIAALEAPPSSRKGAAGMSLKTMLGSKRGSVADEISDTDAPREQLKDLICEHKDNISMNVEAQKDMQVEIDKVKSNLSALQEMYSEESQPGSNATAQDPNEKTSELKHLIHALFPDCSPDEMETQAPIVGLIDGWKMCVAGQSLGPFWYNISKKQVKFKSPLPGTDAQRSRAETLGRGRKMRLDTVICGAKEIPAKRASFGVPTNVTALAVRAEPFIADARLTNTDKVKGNIVMIARGKCSFVSKVKRAKSAGAVGVIIVNADDKPCDVFGETTTVRLPIVSVGSSGCELIRDGERVSISFDTRSDEMPTSSPAGSPALNESPTLPPLMEQSQLQPQHQSVVIASAVPPSVHVHQQQQPTMRSLRERNRLLSHSLGSSSLCSQEGTVQMEERLQAELSAAQAKKSLVPEDSPAGDSRRHEVGALRRPESAEQSHPGVEQKENLEAGRTRPVDLVVKTRTPQGGDLDPSNWTNSEWSVKSQGTAARGRQPQVKISLYRMAVEAVGALKLPPGWSMRMSRTYKQVFFYNKDTGERRWSRPPLYCNTTDAGQDLSIQALSLSKAESGGFGSPEAPEARDGEPDAMYRLTSVPGVVGGISPPVGAVVSHGVVIPPWPQELRSAMGTMARILIGGKQIVCTRAEFGMQADPSRCNGVVTGRIERAQPWLADGDLLNADSMRGCIAVIGRGGCPFTDKARRVERAGAIAAVIVNHADFLFNVLGKAPQVSIPVVSITKADGDSLQNGALAAVQWGESIPEAIEEEAELVHHSTSWSFKMTSKVVHDESVADDEEHPPSVC
mmetsp:Transcript_53153/g.108411  ORF Transcript_53153/g.108411 Transcript_53153/m.108411 type:complete len:1065 (-) Transcript_53153:98-3292(-)|eukprot:CAMPEP_0181291474 /NCGR_PEP_ID=MMETSP1101-20121128/1985_1 /TAXON_ID=46948 /ORGANISM="Rhodomonas abbreviata, Strain Caron Lab Isolate" /LENGTH=1064 /DNA_ID=CAMNT_0023395865 /DNA_START=304 /DNA_END=3498 /DNA_ORIENTATION=-